MDEVALLLLLLELVFVVALLLLLFVLLLLLPTPLCLLLLLPLLLLLFLSPLDNDDDDGKAFLEYAVNAVSLYSTLLYMECTTYKNLLYNDTAFLCHRYFKKMCCIVPESHVEVFE